MKRTLFLAYGVACYLLFLATFAYMAGFVGNALVPKSIDSAPVDSWRAAVVDLLLLGLFALQHSLMARPWFKERWTRIVPRPIERSTYALFSSLVCLFVMWQWQGIGIVLWDVQRPVARAVLWGLFALGWLSVPVVTLLINHFDLFGLRQVWLHFRGRPYEPLAFRTPLLYSRVRHPLYLGWAMAFWATPTMTVGHALFAGTLTLYMAIAAVFEERDLVKHFGQVYREYQQRVPMFLPRLLRKRPVPNRMLAATCPERAEGQRLA